MEEVCGFLGVDPARLPERERPRHENRGRYPWSDRLQYLLNLVVFHGMLDGHRYLDSHLPALRYDALGFGSVARWYQESVVFAFKALSRINCSRRRKPEMKPATRELLKYQYEDRNRGLSELIGKDLSRWWPVTRV